MELATRKIGDTTIIDVRGKLIGGLTHSEMFQRQIKSLLAEGEGNFVVCLRETPWANSQGVGILIGAYTSVRNAGGNLVLSHVTDRIRDILIVTRLITIFRDFESDEEAAAWLEAGGGDRPAAEGTGNTAGETRRTAGDSGRRHYA
jgi:anti-sigma B factor antagonist